MFETFKEDIEILTQITNQAIWNTCEKLEEYFEKQILTKPSSHLTQLNKNII